MYAFMTHSFFVHEIFSQLMQIFNVAEQLRSGIADRSPLRYCGGKYNYLLLNMAAGELNGTDKVRIGGLMPERRNPNDNALELHLSSANPSI